MHMNQIRVQPSWDDTIQGGYGSPPNNNGNGGSFSSSSSSSSSSLPPPQQSMDTSRARPITSTVEGMVPGVSRLLYHSYASQRVGCMHTCRSIFNPFSCACLPSVSAELAKGRYVQVYDNKIEINEPDSYCFGCGTCIVRDRITTIHYDRALIQNVAKAEPCAPNCSHGDCSPTCWGCYGDTLVVYTDRASCCSPCGNCCTTVNTTSSVNVSNATCCVNLGDWFKLPPFCCLPCFPDHKLIFGLDNASELALKINQARALKAAPRAQPPM